MAGCVGCSAEVQLEDTFCARCGAPVTDPFIGTVVGERYRIVSRIGVGGMGAVYRAEHTMMRRDLAIKVLLPELSGKEEFARRFEREAESASRLDHPNIITDDRLRPHRRRVALSGHGVPGRDLAGGGDRRRSDAASSARWRSSARSCAGSTTRTRPASCTAISSRRTSCWSSATASATW